MALTSSIKYDRRLASVLLPSTWRQLLACKNNIWNKYYLITMNHQIKIYDITKKRPQKNLQNGNKSQFFFYITSNDTKEENIQNQELGP